MKRNIITTALAAIATCAVAQNQNIAYQDQNVRFTVITDGAIRMEYTPDGQFLDSKSFIAVDRSYPAAAYKVKNTAKTVTISTDRFVLSYTKGSGMFNEKNLRISSAKTKRKTDGKQKANNPYTTSFSWHPGLKDDANLKGTYRTLDGYDGDTHLDSHKMPLEDGLLSRNGWTFIDDSNGYVFDDSDWQWVNHRPNEGKTQDWYFLAYGHDYKKALRDYTEFAGKVPLPPRYAFGYWWSRYWTYSDNELRNLVTKMHNYDIPLDVLVVDMDWHYAEPSRGGWTGYSWNRRLFPSPKGFLQWAKQQNLQTTLNLHPADGIKPDEDCYPAMAQWMGMNPDEKKAIEWTASDKHFMQGWYEKVLHPMEKDGVDFWWLDWQQWGNDKQFPNLSNTWWINYTTFTDMERNRDTRPMLYHRWGGLGNHRYQIGFSGDAIISWKSLDFQPYFNSTASNVLYGYWSHDMGGHMGAHSIDPEMYIRWMQFGAFSPILRTHSTKDAGLNKEPWVFADRERDILHDIIRQRYQFAPYIYSMARRTYDDALPLCRPMYYDYPESEEAYANRNEYMFGDNVLVYPITSPMHDGISTQQVWLPAGCDWYELSSGTLLRGGQTVQRKFQLDEYPVYVKASSVLPEYGKVENLSSTSEPITVAVYPGKGDSSFTLYEDNGNDKHYAHEYATTLLTKRTLNDSTIAVTIGARKGTYKDMPANRHYTLKLVASAVPTSVKVNGVETPFAYDGNNLSVLIDIPDTDCAKEKIVTIAFPQNATPVADGLIGKFRHIQQGCVALKSSNPGFVFNEQLGTMESTGVAISYAPQEAEQRIEAFRHNYANLKQVLLESGMEEAETDKFIQKAY
ncbi:glycoside hydrolase family 31 protein [Leyella stercorea]|uniref:glycoside hydrolase family 31 protein n=1 Tax=Leyella stercorea TaxID=363265 RepID=UPI00242AF6FF|nr:glycoside hydrolase family 31 protein [Leyella stercorea]